MILFCLVFNNNLCNNNIITVCCVCDSDVQLYRFCFLCMHLLRTFITNCIVAVCSLINNYCGRMLKFLGS